MSTTGSRGRPRPAGVLSPLARTYVGTVTALAVLVGLVTWQVDPGFPQRNLQAVAVLSLMVIFASSGSERGVGPFVLDFGAIILLAAVALVGPAGAVVIGAVTGLFELGRRPLYVRVFNSAMTAIVGGVSGLAYHQATGLVFHGPKEPAGAGDILLHIGAPFLLADVIACLLNVVILAGIVRITDDSTTLRQFITGRLTTSAPAYIGYGVIGFLFVVLWWPVGLDAFSALLILPPLFVAHYAFALYTDEERAHERTLGALVAAVEVKDGYTRGHSERVARLCRLMAGALSMPHQETEALRYAGLLHDIGKLAIPMQILRKAEAMTDEDLAVIAAHAARGVDMLRDIAFLQPSLEGILHHHERVDGRGYPVGLTGNDIPVFARIIAVADAFDSLTTAKAHRAAYSVDRALVELHRRAGTHLDPVMVVALERALARHTWETTTLDAATMATTGRAFDHDDPAASDLMADRAEKLRRMPVLARPRRTA